MQPTILRRELANGVEIVRQLVAGVSPAEARFKPTSETWSILEVVCHLYDEEREDFRPRLDIALHRPEEKWQKIDPAGWVTTRPLVAKTMRSVSPAALGAACCNRF